MEHYHAVLECAGRNRPGHLLAGRRAGWTAVWRAGATAGALDCGAVSFHGELYVHCSSPRRWCWRPSRWPFTALRAGRRRGVRDTTAGCWWCLPRSHIRSCCGQSTGIAGLPGYAARDAVAGRGNGGSRGLLRRALPVVAGGVVHGASVYSVDGAQSAYYFHVFQPPGAAHLRDDPGEVILRGYRGIGTEPGRSTSPATFEFNWPMDGEAIDFAKLRSAPSAAGLASRVGRTAQTDLQRADRRVRRGLYADAGLDARFDALAANWMDAHPPGALPVVTLARWRMMALRPRTETIPIALELASWSRIRGRLRSRLPTPRRTSATSHGGVHRVRRCGGVAAGFPWSEAKQAWRCTCRGDGGEHLRCGWCCCCSSSIQSSGFTLEFFPVFFVWIGALFARGDPVRSRRTGARRGQPSLRDA